MANEDFKSLLANEGLPVEENQIRQQFDDLVAEQGFITNTSRMSPFWRLVTAIAVKPVKWLTDYLIAEILPNLFVKTAKGAWLQIKAWQVGIDFRSATHAKGVVTFTKESADMSVSIKAGTIIQTERLNEVIYQLTVDHDTVIPSGVKSAPVAVTAVGAGADYNLASGYYCVLPEAVAGIAYVANEDDWLLSPGANQETDDELRERYRVKFASVGKHHIDSVYRSLVAEISGLSVDRIYFQHDAPRGPGTANVFLLLDTGVPAQPFIDSINKHLMTDGNHGHGDDVIAFKMPESYHTLGCTIYFRESDFVGAMQKIDIKNEVENMIRCAFRENNNYNVTKTYPYTRFAWSKLGEEIHEKFRQISAIVWSQPDIENPELNIPRIESLTVTVAT